MRTKDLKKRVPAILNRESKAKKPLTEKSDEVVTVCRLLDMGLHKHFRTPEKIIEAIRDSNVKGKTTKKVKNSQGQYISLFAKFLKRLGNSELGISKNELDDILKPLYDEARRLREEEYENDRRQGKITVGHKRRDVHGIPFFEIIQKAQSNYEEATLLYSKIKLTRSEYDTLLNSIILMCYTIMAHIRSRWVDLRMEEGLATFDDYRHSNWIARSEEDGKFYIHWNDRKKGSKRFVQEIPQPLVEILKRFMEKTKSHHLLVDFDGKPLTAKKMQYRIKETFKKLLGKPIAVSDLRRLQITHFQSRNDPVARQNFARECHHSKYESDLYFRYDPESLSDEGSAGSDESVFSEDEEVEEESVFSDEATSDEEAVFSGDEESGEGEGSR
jgi:integrase